MPNRRARNSSSCGASAISNSASSFGDRAVGSLRPASSASRNSGWASAEKSRNAASRRSSPSRWYRSSKLKPKRNSGMGLSINTKAQLYGASRGGSIYRFARSDCRAATVPFVRVLRRVACTLVCTRIRDQEAARSSAPCSRSRVRRSPPRSPWSSNSRTLRSSAPVRCAPCSRPAFVRSGA